MRIDYSIPLITIVLLAIQIVGGVIVFMRAYAAIERSIAERFQEVALMLNTMKEGDLRELRARVLLVETGQDEWTKTLRTRTHELANLVNGLKLQVDRLERPNHYPSVTP